MKRYKFSQHLDAPVIDLTVGEVLQPETVEDKPNEVFGMIYGSDPLTGRPRSDLGTYMSENANPVVRDFVERQLRQDFSGKVVKAPDGLTDVDIAYLTKDRNETIEDYSLRVRGYLNKQKATFGELSARQRVREAVKSRKSNVESK